MMPRSAPGRSEVSGETGFSLIETLVVLSIVAIVAAIVGLSPWTSNPTRLLDREATRLARLFEYAQNDARARNVPVQWRFDRAGYAFITSPAESTQSSHRISRTSGTRSTFETGALRPRQWESLASMHVHVDPPQATTFGPSWYAGPSMVELRSEGHSVQIRRTLAGQYEVMPTTRAGSRQ